MILKLIFSIVIVKFVQLTSNKQVIIEKLVRIQIIEKTDIYRRRYIKVLKTDLSDRLLSVVIQSIDWKIS